MNVDSDIKLYNDYINGQVEAFEKIYLKYKNKIEYFVLRIVKDYEKAEDITQEVFFDLIKNKFKETDGSLKYYLYLIAKSKSLTYLNTEKRRNNITEKYLTSDDTENDILDTITEEENKKELMEAISIINEKYRDVIYLVKIEEFSYKEVASILNISIQDVKNYVHRGKKELRNIFIKYQKFV